MRVRGDGDGLALRLTATLGGLEFRRDGDRIRWQPPEALREPLAAADLDVTDALRSSRAQVYLHSLRDGAEYLLPSETEVALGERPVLTSRASVDATTAAGGGPLSGDDWEVRAVVIVAGFRGSSSARRKGAPLVLTSSAPARVVARRGVGVRQPLARRLATRLPRVVPFSAAPG